MELPRRIEKKYPDKLTDQHYKFSKVIKQLLKKRSSQHTQVGGISLCNICEGHSLSQDRRGIFTFMKQHVFTHIQLYPYECTICKQYESSNSSKVKAHIARVHGKGKNKAEAFMSDRRRELDEVVVEWALKCYKDD